MSFCILMQARCFIKEFITEIGRDYTIGCYERQLKLFIDALFISRQGKFNIASVGAQWAGTLLKCRYQR